MKLTIQVEEEIKQLMDDYWNSYFEGNLGRWANYLVDDYRNIGGTEEEIWNSKKEILDYTHRIIDQMQGASEIRNKQVQIIPYDPYVMVHELLDIYIKVENEWTFYQKFRLSSLIQKTGEGWKVLHQHGSYPDSKTAEGEAFAFNVLESENKKLQKAIQERTLELEQKNRDLQIESALERIRAVAMGMHKQDDMLGVCKALYHELRSLGFSQLRNALIHSFVDKEKYFSDYDYSEATGGAISRIPYTGNVVIEKFIKNIRTSGEGFFEHALEKKELQDWIAFRKENNEVDDPRLENIESLHYYNYSVGSSGIGISTYKCITREQLEVLERFKNVFKLAYKRYSDISLAEAQAKESHIQLALERIRARTMAMQKSDELLEASALLFQQLRSLGINCYTSGFTIWNSDDLISWMCNADGSMNPPFTMPVFENEWHRQQYASWLNGEDFISKDLAGEELVFYLNYLRSFPLLDEAFKTSIAAGHPMPERQVHNVANFSQGNLLFITLAPVPEAHEIFIRFAKVFEQTYTRFLDLQKAEAQSRESQIQLALERLRARTMAMQHSNELLDAATLLFQQIKSLGTSAWNCSFNIWTEDKKQAIAWNATKEGFGRPFDSPSNQDVFQRFYEAFLKGEELYVEAISGDALKHHYDYLSTLPGVGETLAELKAAGVALPTFQIFNIAYFTQGYLMFITFEPVPELWDIFKRFAKVFEQTYTRFFDLQKAEAQARDAQIEAALERVRSRSLAMHRTSEIQEVIYTVHDEMLKLNISIFGGSFIVINKDVDAKLYAWGSGGTADTTAEMLVPDFEMPFCTDLIQGIVKGAGFFTEEFSKADKIKYFTELFKHAPWSKLPAKDKQAVLESEGGYTRSICVSKHTTIFIINQNGRKFTDDENEILKRFSKVFEQSYTRFLDLQKAEAQAREAQVEAALERVRSRTLAMQHSDELGDASFILDSQVRALGIKTRGCAFNIFGNNESTEWFSSEMGTMPTYKTPRENLFLHYYNVGQSGQPIYIESFEGAACAAHYKYLCTLPIMGDALRSMIAAGGSFPQNQVDHVVYFKYGYLLFITLEPVPEAHDVFIRFAKVFEQTYTRFLDLQKAEAQAVRAEQDLIEIKAARKKAEETLAELQVTQKQLIQSEKMASLGELTAGIAHEIQNPLNFVNNFSDVNKELLEELKEEADKGNFEDVKLLADDIMDNEDKINHHGKRADAIVKGMLQHSRISSGTKEPTDINALCDEYLRLSYHGLRAKNNSFNAAISTDLDKSIGNINIIPQDIGRVILNLLTNAFYAVDEKKKASQANLNPSLTSYKPTVTISTKKIGDIVEIKVSDNGNGISQKVVDKIFQPFFTTKPTGQGTGLGLSLAFDIVSKGHDGKLKVDTKEGVGTDFIILLPL